MMYFVIWFVSGLFSLSAFAAAPNCTIHILVTSEHARMLPRARVRACTASASQNATRVEEQLPRAAVPRVLEAVVVEQSPSGIATVHDLGDVMLG